MDAINSKMVKFLPELSSDYGKYPMNHGTRWLHPRDNGPKGEPCYIRSTNVGIKNDYVFGRGPFGEGYYHLLTKDSYKNLYARLLNECPVACCACNKTSRKLVDEWDDVKRIIYARSVAMSPNDTAAANDAINEAKQTANNWYHGTQNEQLAVGVVQFSTM